MEFTVWKTQRCFGENARLFRFSLRAGKTGPPVILDQYQFESLFPDIDMEAVPLAPNTTKIVIDAEIET